MKKIISAAVITAILLTFTACEIKRPVQPSEPQSVGGENSQYIPQVVRIPDKDLKRWDVLPEISETPQSEFEYETADGGVFVTGYKGSGRAVYIPETIDGKTVKKVVLKDLDIDEVIFPKTAEECRLSDCPVKYANVVNSNSRFSCDNIEAIYIEDGVTEVNSSLLLRSGEENIKRVRMPSTITKIGDHTFSRCKKLEYIEIPEGVTEIGENAFMSCKLIEEIKLPEGVSIIPKDAFSGCDNLKTVRLGSSVKIIEDGAFSHCDSLSEIEIPEGTEYIGDSFRYTALTSLKLPDSLLCLDAAAFVGTPDGLTITVNGKTYHKLDDELYKQFYKDDLLIYNGVVRDCWKQASGEITVPEGVTEIGDYAITFNDVITKITLPDSIKIINDGAFNGCKALTEVNIPEGVTTIGALVFDGCMSLKKIALPDSLEEIDIMAFDDISYNGDHAFKDWEITYKGEIYTEDNIRDLYLLFRLW